MVYLQGEWEEGGHAISLMSPVSFSVKGYIYFSYYPYMTHI